MIIWRYVGFATIALFVLAFVNFFLYSTRVETNFANDVLPTAVMKPYITNNDNQSIIDSYLTLNFHKPENISSIKQTHYFKEFKSFGELKHIQTGNFNHNNNIDANKLDTRTINPTNNISNEVEKIISNIPKGYSFMEKKMRSPRTLIDEEIQYYYTIECPKTKSNFYIYSTSTGKVKNLLVSLSHNTRDYEPRNGMFEFVDASNLKAGAVAIRHINTKLFVRIIKPPLKPEWILQATKLSYNSLDCLFEIEAIDSNNDSIYNEYDSYYIKSIYTGGYINCIPPNIIRGHKTGDPNSAAPREDSTRLIIHQTYIDNNNQIENNNMLPFKIKANKFESIESIKTPISNNIIPDGVNKCAISCKWEYKLPFGFNSVAFQSDVSDFVCPSTFRDLTDYSFAWPYSHFKEKVKIVDPKLAASCLAPIPLIYVHTTDLRSFYSFSIKSLKRHYILITGQSDMDSNGVDYILRDKNLLLWFAQNADTANSKIIPLPIGINCFEMGPEMSQTLAYIRSTNIEKTKLVLVNFGNTHPSRRLIWLHFCDSKSPNAQFSSCSIKTQQNNVMNNPHLVGYYKQVAQHKYVVAPRGNGWDTHRVWESLYLGCVPIVEHSPLDKLYSAYPILIVNKYQSLTRDILEQEYYKIVSRFDSDTYNKLRRSYWRDVIESARNKLLAERGIAISSNRTRCWGK